MIEIYRNKELGNLAVLKNGAVRINCSRVCLVEKCCGGGSLELTGLSYTECSDAWSHRAVRYQGRIDIWDYHPCDDDTAMPHRILQPNSLEVSWTGSHYAQETYEVERTVGTESVLPSPDPFCGTRSQYAVRNGTHGYVKLGGPGEGLIDYWCGNECTAAVPPKYEISYIAKAADDSTVKVMRGNQVVATIQNGQSYEGWVRYTNAAAGSLKIVVKAS